MNGLKGKKKNLVTFESVENPVCSLSVHSPPSNRSIILSAATALGLLVIFGAWNFWLDRRWQQRNFPPDAIVVQEPLPDSATLSSRHLTFFDSVRMNSQTQFSPGLGITFRDLNPGNPAWIRITGNIWFSCRPEEVACNLVVTCNHKGINYKYVNLPLAKEPLKSHQWNKVSLDYRIPKAPDSDDLLQAYFWYFGTGEVQVNEIRVSYYEEKGGNR